MNSGPYVHMNLTYLTGVGFALLTFSFGFRVVIALRKEEKLETVFVELAIGLLGITFFPSFIQVLNGLSDLLTNEVKTLGDSQALVKLVIQSMTAAANEPDAYGNKVLFNVPSMIEQLFRDGVWGIASSIADFFFVIAQAFIEIRRDVLQGLVIFFTPIIWGFYPLRPGMGQSVTTYVIEMSLWGPCVYLIDTLIARILPTYLHRPGSLGVPIIALEVVSIVLILGIPQTVHQLFAGVLYPAGESALLGFVSSATSGFALAESTLLRLKRDDEREENKKKREKEKAERKKKGWRY